MSKKRIINVPIVGRRYGKTDLERVGNAYSSKIAKMHGIDFWDLDS